MLNTIENRLNIINHSAGIGGTSMLLNQALSIMEAGGKVGIISLELSEYDVLRRISELSGDKIQDTIDKGGNAIVIGVAETGEFDIRNVANLSRLIAETQDEHDIKFDAIFIDCYDQMFGGCPHNMNRGQYIFELAQQLNGFASLNNITLWATGHVCRVNPLSPVAVGRQWVGADFGYIYAMRRHEDMTVIYGANHEQTNYQQLVKSTVHQTQQADYGFMIVGV